MKIKVVRASGQPVDPKKADEYTKAWQEGFDRAVDKFGKFGPEVNDQLDQLEKDLHEQFNDLSIVEWEFPKSKKAWLEKLNEYGQVMVTTNVETGELLFVVLDQQFL